MNVLRRPSPRVAGVQTFDSACELKRFANTVHCEYFGRSFLFRSVFLARRDAVLFAAQQCGVDLDEPNSMGITPYQCALEADNVNMALLLAELGADTGGRASPLPGDDDVSDAPERVRADLLKFTDPYSIGALMCSAAEDRDDVTEWLYRRAERGVPPLHVVACAGNRRVFHMLVALGEDPTETDDQGYTAEQILTWAEEERAMA